MKAYFLSAILWLASLVMPATQAKSEGYPFQDPYYATITAAVLKAHEKDKEVNYRDVSLKMLPARDDVPYYGSTQNKFKLRYWPTKGKAPLIVMITGLGGHAGSTYYNFLAYHFVKKGYHVLAVPNPLHYSFALAGSTSGFPGVTRDDARDLYATILKGVDKLQRKAGLEYSSVGLVGVSLGALEAAYLSELDSREKKLNFQRVLLINPPVDPLFGIHALDRLASQGAQISDGRKDEIQKAVYQLGFFTLIAGDITSLNYFDRLEQLLPTTLEERQYLIGSSLQGFLQSLLFTTQQVHDLGIFKTDVATADPEPRLAEAKAFSFTDYINKFLLPGLSAQAGKPLSYDDILPVTGMQGVEAHLRADSRVLLMHNADDFIVSQEQLQWLQSVFGARMKLYPYGGHLGNIWYPDNLAAILGAFGDLPR